MSYTNFVQVKVSGFKIAPAQGVLGMNNKKTSSSEPLGSELEIWYVILSSGPLPNVFKTGPIPGVLGLKVNYT